MAWIPKKDVKVNPGGISAVVAWFFVWGATVVWLAMKEFEPPSSEWSGILGGIFASGIAASVIVGNWVWAVFFGDDREAE